MEFTTCYLLNALTTEVRLLIILRLNSSGANVLVEDLVVHRVFVLSASHLEPVIFADTKDVTFRRDVEGVLEPKRELDNFVFGKRLNEGWLIAVNVVSGA